MMDEGVYGGRSRFFSNTVALVVLTAGTAATTLLQVKILSNYLTQEMFGLFASLRGFSLLIATVAANGLPYVLVRFIPVHEAHGRRRRAVTLGVVCFAVSVLFLAVLSLLVDGFKHLFFAFTGDAPLGDAFYFWFYAATLGVTLKVILYGGLNGIRRLTAQVVLELLSMIGILAWIVLARERLSLHLLFRILGTVNLLTAGAGLPVLFFYILHGTGAHPSRRGEGLRQGYTSYLAWATGLSFVAVAFTDVDRYVLSQLIAAETLALFHIGSRVARLANRLLGVPNLALQPEVTRLDAEGRLAQAHAFTKLFLKFNCALAVFLAFTISVFAREVIAVVANEQYAAGVVVLVLLAVSLPLSTMTAPITTVMKALDQVRAALWCDLAWAVTYIALLVLLSPRLQLVGIGIAQISACAVQLALAAGVSRLPVDYAFLIRLATRCVLANAIAFTPILLLDYFVFVSGRGLSYVILLKLVLLAGAFWGAQQLVYRFSAFDADERTALSAFLESKRMGALARLLMIRPHP